MPVAAVTVATALGAALFTLIMGLATNLPFALAAGLGINAVVAFQIVGPGVPWPVAMACVVIEGVIAIVLVLAGLREAIMRAIPHEIKLSIGVGIGLFITLVGLRDAGITVNNPATGISLGDVTAGPPLIALAGLLTMIVLTARNVKGSILIGIVVSTVLGLIFGVLEGPDELRAVDPEQQRLLDDRRRARARQPARRAHVGAGPPDLRAVRDRLLRHDRHGGRGLQRGRHAGRERSAAAPEAPAARGLASRRPAAACSAPRPTRRTWSRARASPRARARASRRVDHRRLLPADDLLRAADRRGRADRAARRAGDAPGGRTRADHDRLPDDPAGRGRGLEPPGGRDPRVLRDRGRAADVLDRGRHRSRHHRATSR